MYVKKIERLIEKVGESDSNLICERMGWNSTTGAVAVAHISKEELYVVSSRGEFRIFLTLDAFEYGCQVFPMREITIVEGKLGNYWVGELDHREIEV